MKAVLFGRILGSITISPIEPNGVITVSISIPATFLSLGMIAPAISTVPLTSSLLRSSNCFGLTQSTGCYIGAWLSYILFNAPEIVAKVITCVEPLPSPAVSL